MIFFYATALYMILTKKGMVVLMAATMIAVVSIGIAPLITPEAFAVKNLNSSKSNIYAIVVPQETEQSCINQADGQGDKTAVGNSEQAAQAADGSESAANLGVDQSKEGESTEGDTDITANADQTNDCSSTQEQTVNIAAEGPVSGTVETTE
jgi:hypothetical protein